MTSGNGTTALGNASIMDNDLVSKVTGTENEPVTLGWAELGLNQIEGDVTKVMITSMPQDGILTLENVNGIGSTSVTVSQVISRSDIESGKLRFWPDAYESGVDAYGLDGVGNKLSDYAQLKYTAFTSDGITHTDSTVTIDIAPKVNPDSISLLPIQTNMGSNASLFTLQINGSLSDKDGSESILIGFHVYNSPDVFSYYSANSRTPLTPDADGMYWAPAGSQVLIAGKRNDAGELNPWSAAFDLHLRELNQKGDVLDEAIILAPTTYQSVWWSPGGSCPLVLDLDGNGVQTVGVDHGVRFDLKATGDTPTVGWTDGRDGLLVLDRNGNGRIDDGAELFGEGTTLANGLKAPDGFTALAEADDNGDGVINAQDAVFGQLQVWVDANIDGVTQAGELKGLAELGVVEFNLKATTGTEVQNGNLLGLLSDYTTADGQRHDLVDVWFAVAPEAAPAALEGADLLQSPSALEQATAAEATELGQRASTGHLALMSHALHAGAHHEWQRHEVAMH
ncbi:MAG: hypothetical protein U5L74_14500 [Ideonella sp.]|nr:hypothetical protein [Ideonella sp.]